MIRWYMVFALLLGASEISAQEATPQSDSTNTVKEFILSNGKKIKGHVVRRTKEFYFVITEKSDTVQIDIRKILGIVTSTNVVDKKVFQYYENNYGFKYFIFNTAIPLEKKTWYCSNQYVLVSNFNYGLSKRTSTGISFFTFSPSSLFSPKIKFTINPASKVKFAISAQYLYVRTWTSDRGYVAYNFGFAQAITTIGDPQNNFTIGIGKSISAGGVGEGLIATLGVVKKISPKLTLLTEDIILYDPKRHSTIGLLSLGVRFDRKKHAFDVGVFVPAVLERLSLLPIPLPFISYNLKLTK